MRLALSKFGDETRGAEIALLFFAGHSAVIKGKTWLIPVNATKNNLETAAIDLTLVLTAASNATKAGLVLIYACYKSRVFSGGCAKASVPDRTVLVYSSQPGVSVAPSNADHSVYAEALRTYMEVRGLSFSTF
jgi:hypothetical protein